MPTLVSIEDLMGAGEKTTICAMPHLSPRAETTASGDALCSMRPVGVGWRSEHKNDSKERQAKK